MQGSSEHPHEALRELARRTCGGVEVRLSWRESDGAVFVGVSSETAGPQFMVQVDPAAALDAYRHPYAFATHGRSQRAEVTAP